MANPMCHTSPKTTNKLTIRPLISTSDIYERIKFKKKSLHYYKIYISLKKLVGVNNFVMFCLELFLT